MEENVPQFLLNQLTEKLGLSISGNSTTQLLVYGGTSVLLSQFLQVVTGSTSLVKMDLQGFQLQQIQRELQAIHQKVRIIANHKTQAAVDFFIRGEYEEARDSAIEGFRSAVDIEHKVISTRIKMLTEILVMNQKEQNNGLNKFNSGITIKRCLDDLLDDTMVLNCWNNARKYRLVPNSFGDTKKNLDLIDELLVSTYPTLSYCLEWTDPDKSLNSLDSQEIIAKLNTKYLAEGEEDFISIIFGKYQDSFVRMDVFKTVSNELSCKFISSHCFQDEIRYNIKSRPEKGVMLEIHKCNDSNQLEFNIKTSDNGMTMLLQNNSENQVNICRKIVSDQKLNQEETINDEYSQIFEIQSDTQNLPNSGDKKAKNLRCCLSDICFDNDEMWEDETLDKYTEIIGCNACFIDENEDGYLYHPECYKKKHDFMNTKSKNNHFNSKKVLITEDLKTLSKADRILKIKPDCTLTFSTINTFLPSLPNVTAAAIAVGKAAINTGTINVVDEIGTVVLSLGEGAALGLGAGLAAGALVIELGYHARQWSKGSITSEDFKVKGIQATVGSLSSFACATIGSVIGSAIVPGLGTFIGGVIGALVGAVAGYTARKLVEWGFDYDEDSKRADLIIEAFHFLDLPAFHLINERVVEQSFRKLALECHPDSVRVKARDARERSIAEVQWQLLQHAKDVALGYFMNKHCFSQRCKTTIKKKYDPLNRDTATFNELNDSLDESKNSANNKVIL